MRSIFPFLLLVVSSLFACQNKTVSEENSVYLPSLRVEKIPSLPQTQKPAGKPSPKPIIGSTNQEIPLRYVLTKSKENIRTEANTKAEILGQSLAGARLPVFEEQVKAGCKSFWVRVQYNGWLCEDRLLPALPSQISETHPENRYPTQKATVKQKTDVYSFPEEEIVKSKAPESSVRVTRVVEINQKAYAQIGPFAYVLAQNLEFEGRGKWDTSLQGAFLGKHSQFPIAFIRTEKTPVFASPEQSHPENEIKTLKRFDQRSVLEESYLDGVSFIKIGDGWVRREDLILIFPEEKPDDIPLNAHWVLIDLSEQTISAYQGEQLVFASLVSSGRQIKTPTGTYGIERKYRYKSMAGNVAGESYSVSNVPWAQFFRGSYALHGAFWHNKFGRRASHGCVNLAPKDALWLAEFLLPVVPPGWLSIFPPEGMETSFVVVKE